MNTFAENARRIFEVAEFAASAGEASDLTILVSPEGGLRLLTQTEQAGWPLNTLRAECGAAMAYRVTRQQAHILMEGCSDARSIHLQAPAPVTLRSLLNFVPQYVFA